MTQSPAGELPRVLVLLATYNGERFLEEQLRSLAAQRGVRLSLLVSDDCSSDQSIGIVRSTCRDSRIELQLLENDRGSGSAARNFFRLFMAADYSGCDYVALCDQDDIWLPEKLCAAIDCLRATGSDLYSSNTTPFWPDGREVAVRKNYRMRRWDFLFESASQGSTYVFRAEVGARFSSFLAGLGESVNAVDYHDWFMYAWARAAGLAWIIDDRSYIRYRQSEFNVLGANVGMSALTLRVSLLRQGWLRRQSLLVGELVGLGESPIVARLRRFGVLDRLAIAWSARDCRRRPRDQLVFAAACLFFGM